MPTRRDLLAGTVAAALGPAWVAKALGAVPVGQDSEHLYSISLAQWSLHRKLRAGGLDNLDFAAYAREQFDIRAVEYVNQFFKDRATDFDYLARMKANAEAAGVRSLLIMIDGEGALAAGDEDQRQAAVRAHFKWIPAAAFLGCHSIRVNAGGSTDREAGMRDAARSLRTLAMIGDDYDINVIVENHGGLSSDGAWLAGVMEAAGHPRVGTLPDFGNFRLGGGKQYDRYRGVRELMPFAKAVSAKSHEFDDAGDEVHTDYRRMLRIVVREAGYRGFVGVEYEGGRHSEDEGIRLTRDLLLRVRTELEQE
jgi:L-ribulose-5-phosphate 3-epimerase